MVPSSSSSLDALRSVRKKESWRPGLAYLSALQQEDPVTRVSREVQDFPPPHLAHDGSLLEHPHLIFGHAVEEVYVLEVPEFAASAAARSASNAASSRPIASPPSESELTGIEASIKLQIEAHSDPWLAGTLERAERPT
jgi:hypothetical protein